MRILLNAEESQEYIIAKAREKILEETSRFPANMKLPDGHKPRPIPLTKDQKADILRLHDDGMARSQIARELHLPGRQVSGVVQAHDNATKKMHVGPEVEGLRPMQPLVVPEAENLGRRSMGQATAAEDGKMHCSQKKVPIVATKKPKPIRSNSEIDGLIVEMAGKPHIDIAVEINRRFGGAWLPNDVGRRIGELREKSA